MAEVSPCEKEINLIVASPAPAISLQQPNPGAIHEESPVYQFVG